MVTTRSRSCLAAMALAGTLVGVSGCSVRLLDFTVISSKNVNVPVPQSSRGATRVSGSDFVYVIIIPLGVPNLKEALDRAIESAGPGYDALIDGVLYRRSGLFKMGFTVEGTPIKTATLKAALGNSPVLYHSSVGRSNSEGVAKAGIIDTPLTSDELATQGKKKGD